MGAGGDGRGGAVFQLHPDLVLLAGLALAIGVPREEPTVGAMRAFPFEGPSLQEGDVIRAVEGQPTPDWERFAAVTDGLKGKALVAYSGRRWMRIQGTDSSPDFQLRCTAASFGLS